MDIQMTMWGDSAKLMEDLATAHCYCEYTKVEDLDTITREDENAADVMLPALRRERLEKKRLLFGGHFHYSVNGYKSIGDSPCPLHSHRDDITR